MTLAENYTHEQFLLQDLRANCAKIFELSEMKFQVSKIFLALFEYKNLGIEQKKNELSRILN